MERAQHTPGPWEAEPGGGKGAWIKGATGEWSALACGDVDATAMANARLIATAPELLTLLREALDSRAPDFIGGDWFNRAHAAIAKAEGQ